MFAMGAGREDESCRWFTGGLGKGGLPDLGREIRVPLLASAHQQNASTLSFSSLVPSIKASIKASMPTHTTTSEPEPE